MATRVKAKSKIGKRLKARQKAGKSTSLAIGPGAVGNIMKGSKMGKALADTLKKLRAEAKARIAARAKTKPVPLPKGVKPKQFSIAEAQAKLKPQSRLTGDLTKIPKSQLSPADQVRQGFQLSRKRVKSGGVSSKDKVSRKATEKESARARRVKSPRPITKAEMARKTGRRKIGIESEIIKAAKGAKRRKTDK